MITGTLSQSEQDFIAAHMGLAGRAVGRMLGQFPWLDADELASQANLGLLRAVEVVRARVRGEGTDVPRRRRRAPTEAEVRVLPAATEHDRAALAAGDAAIGPVRITEHTGTTWVPHGWRAVVGSERELVLERMP